MQPDRFDATPERCPRCQLPVYSDAWTGEPIEDDPTTGYRWHRCQNSGTSLAGLRSDDRGQRDSTRDTGDDGMGCLRSGSRATGPT